MWIADSTVVNQRVAGAKRHSPRNPRILVNTHPSQPDSETLENSPLSASSIFLPYS
jgi:hypothetical protein